MLVKITMIKQKEFKQENIIESMATRYLLWELNINKRFARKQKVSWTEVKNYVFNILQQVSEKNLFSSSDRTRL